MQILKTLSIPKIDLISAFNLGDDLSKYALSVIQFKSTIQKVHFAAAGKYLAHLMNIALLYHSFWMSAVQDKDRLIELKRFEEATFTLETAVAEVTAGRKLLNVFKHVKNETNFNLIAEGIKWKVIGFETN